MKRLSRRDFLKLTGATLLAASLPNLDAVRADHTDPVPLIWHGSSRHRYLALTYDDCYLLNRMHDLEKLLYEYPDFKVTLFPVGLAIQSLEGQDPGIWSRFLDMGQEIGYHSWDHESFGPMSSAAALNDYERWYDALSKALGFEPKVRFGRPTFGFFSPSFDEVCRVHGLVNTMWSTGWGGALEDGQHAAEDSKNGDIVLMHIRTEDLNTSAKVYPWMRENEWGSVTLTQLYDDLLLEQYNPDGCEMDWDNSLTRTCIETE